MYIYIYTEFSLDNGNNQYEMKHIEIYICMYARARTQRLKNTLKMQVHFLF